MGIFILKNLWVRKDSIFNLCIHIFFPPTFPDKQTNCRITNEWHDCFNFEEYHAKDHRKAIDLTINRLAAFVSRRVDTFGDIALWNLPYLKTALDYENVKILILESDYKTAAKNLDELLKIDNGFPFLSDHSQRFYKSYNFSSKYQECFPKFDYRNVENAVPGDAIDVYFKEFFRGVLVNYCTKNF